MTEPVVIGNATLYLGDCTDVLPTIDKVDAVVTDPPYGIGMSKSNNRPKDNLAKTSVYEDSDWDNETPSPKLMSEIISLAKWSCVWGGNYFSLGPSRTWLVWDKMLRGQNMADCELAWTNYKGKGVRLYRHLWAGFFRDGNDPRGIHPTQKPENVMAWSIRNAPDNPKTILDPFMGSGTTGVASVQMGRKFIGIEREPRYFEIACKRIEDAQRQSDLFIGAA